MVYNIGDNKIVVQTAGSGSEVSSTKSKDTKPGFIPMVVEKKDETASVEKENTADTAKLQEKRDKKLEKYEKETQKLEEQMKELEKQLQDLEDSGVDCDSKQYKDLQKKCDKVFSQYQKKAFVSFALAENYIPAELASNINSATEDTVAYEYMEKRTELFDKATTADNEESYQRERLALEEKYKAETKQYEGKEIPLQIQNKYRVLRANLIMNKNDKWSQWSIEDLKNQNSEIYSGSDQMRENPQGFKINNASAETKMRTDANVNSVSVDAQYTKGDTKVSATAGIDNQNFYNGTSLVSPKAKVRAETKINKFDVDTYSNYSESRSYYGETFSDTKSISYSANVNYKINDKASAGISSDNYTSFTDNSSSGNSKYYYNNIGINARFPLSKTVSMNTGYTVQYDSDLGHQDIYQCGVNYNGKTISAGLTSSYTNSDTVSSVSESMNFSIKNKDYYKKGGVKTDLSGSWTRSDTQYGEGDNSASSVRNSFNTSEQISYKTKQGREISVSHGGYYSSSKTNFGGKSSKSTSSQNTVSVMTTQLGKNKDWGVGMHYTWNKGESSNPNEFGVSVTKRF